MSLDGYITINVQPIFCASTLGITYAEVLLRPINKNIGVAQVLSQIESCGRSEELDKFILQKACEFIRDNVKKSAVKITVNLSRGTLERPNVYKDLVDIIQNMRVRKRYIVLELHELTDYSNITVRQNIEGLIQCSISLAMDDFGIGNANLNTLSSAGVKVVKFDRIFLDIKDRRQLSYTMNLIQGMHSLGIDTIIEGVETEEQLSAVRSMGYKHIQGFILAKPMSTETYKNLYS